MLELGDRAGRGRLVDELLLELFELAVGEVVEVEVVVEAAEVAGRAFQAASSLPRLPDSLLGESLLQAPPPASQRLVDRLRRGGQAALQDGEREADDGAAAALAFRLEPVGAVHLLADVLGDPLVQQRLVVGQRVRGRVGAALGEQRPAVEVEQLLLHHAAHQVRRIDHVRGVARFALEAVGVEQRQEQLEVLLLAGVRRRRHQQQVACQRPASLPSW